MKFKDRQKSALPNISGGRGHGQGMQNLVSIRVLNSIKRMDPEVICWKPELIALTLLLNINPSAATRRSVFYIKFLHSGVDCGKFEQSLHDIKKSPRKKEIDRSKWHVQSTVEGGMGMGWDPIEDSYSWTTETKIRKLRAIKDESVTSEMEHVESRESQQ